MRLLINTTNMMVGGSIQVSLSLIDELKKHSINEYHILLSPAVEKQIDVNSFPNNFKFYTIRNTPASLKYGAEVRRQLNDLERDIKPDLIFTVFGPAFWTPKTLHVSGYANGWCYNPDSIAFKRFSRISRLKFKLTIFFRNLLIKRANYLIVETATAKRNIMRYLKLEEQRIFVVGNTYHQVYNQISTKNKRRLKEDGIFRLLILSADYPHKNLEIVNKISKELTDRGRTNFKFYMTLPEDTFHKRFAGNSLVENLGVQEIKDCPSLYEKVDALFLPSLLETFTANYPEAMVMKKPIITSDLDFAHELCGEAAIYCNPLDEEDITSKIILLSENEMLYESLVKKGIERLSYFETAESRVVKYLEIFNQVIKCN